MVLDPSISAAARTAAADAVCALVNVGVPNGLLNIYDGTVPSDVDAPLGSATLLGTLSMSNPAFAPASNGVAVANPIAPDGAADANGNASFFRVTNAAGVAVIQGRVGVSGSDLNLSSTAITAGGIIMVDSLVYTQVGS